MYRSLNKYLKERYISFRSHRRYKAKVKRRLKKNNKKSKAFNFYKSEVLEYIQKKLKNQNQKFNGRRVVEIKMPKIFSLIENPKDSLEVILSLCNFSRKIKISSIIFDHSNVEEIDLSAEGILGFLAREIEKENIFLKKKIIFKGKYPKSTFAKRLIKGIGVVANLNTPLESVPEIEKNKIRVFLKKNIRKKTTLKYHDSAHILRVSNDFVNHFNSCLKDNGRSLIESSKKI